MPQPQTRLLAPTLAPLGDRPREALVRLGSLGFAAVQLSAAQPGLRPRELDHSARRDLLSLLRRVELAPAGLDAWVPAEHLAAADRSDRAVAALCAAIHLAADLGRVPLSVILPIDKGPAAAGAVAAVTAEAARCGVTLADHNVPPLTGQANAAGIDPASWLAAGGDPAEAVTIAGERLASARLVDLLTNGARAPVGGAHGARLDVGAYKAALASNGYRGHIVIDARGWSEPWAGIEQSAQAWERANQV